MILFHKGNFGWILFIHLLGKTEQIEVVGLLLYIREDIPCREIIINIEPNIEAMFVEINL